MDSAASPPLASLAPHAPAQPVATATLLRRFAFRFCFAYFLLYGLPQPFTELPLTGWLDTAFEASWHWAANVVGVHLLHLAPFTFRPPAAGTRSRIT